MFHAMRARIIVLTALAAAPAVAAEPISVSLTEDPALRSLVEEALQKRPELAQARALIEAERQRIPQARALPDPVLSLGLQNDSFRRWEIGRMEMSYFYITASQSVPWFGKRGLRAGIAASGVRSAEARVGRTELALRAEVERAYLDLVQLRDRLVLLGKLDALWTQSEGAALSRYESGEGAQSDVLRAQLERVRLRQRRLTLQAEETRRLAVLNRLRGRDAAEPVETARHLQELADPALPPPEQAIADADARSPELRAAQLEAEAAGQRTELARKDYWPDLTFTAGVMPRGGGLETMWTAGLSFGVPVWAASKQARAVAEGAARRNAAGLGAEAIRRLLHQRIRERLALLAAQIESNRLFRSGLLVQSEATVASTLAQYRVGRVPFASVLEALGGYVADQDGFLRSVAEAQRLAISMRELSLDDPAGAAPAAAEAAMPGAGGLGSANASTSEASPSTTSMSRM